MYLFTNFLLFVLICRIVFFIILPIKIFVPIKSTEGLATSVPKKTYIGLEVIISSIIFFIIMFFLLIIKFDLGAIFRQ